MADEKKEHEESFLHKYKSLLVSIVIIIFCLMLGGMNFIKNIELGAYDYRMSKIKKPPPVRDDLVVLSIGDESYNTMQRKWPWPRDWYAHVIDNLSRAQAKLIVFDIQFDSYSEDLSKDSVLADAIERAGNVILASKITTIRGSDDAGNIFDSQKSIPLLQDVAYTNANVSMQPDPDGIYRENFVAVEVSASNSDDPRGVYQYGDTYFKYEGTLATESFKFLKGYEKSEPILRVGDDFQIGTHKIRTHKDGSPNPNSFLINFVGPSQSYKYYEFAEVIDDEDFDIPEDFDMDVFDDPGDKELDIPPGILYSEQLKDKIVFVGVTLSEAVDDNKPTPFSSAKGDKGTETPGVEVHLNALQTMLDGAYIEYLSLEYQRLIQIFLGLLVFWMIRRFSTKAALISLFVILISFIAINFMLFTGDIVINFFLPILTMFLVFAANYVMQYLESQKEAKMIKGAFAHYVPAKVVESLIDNPNLLQLGGEEREMSVLFSDVAGFTTISENLTPHELVNLLNEYLTAMTDLVLMNDGIIDKYEGDAIMAEWGAPIPFHDHAYKSVHTAILMQRKLKELRPMWKERGLPDVTARVGINTGKMVVGNMGSRDVFDYTVMGDAVNLASRLEGANKPYKTDIMISVLYGLFAPSKREAKFTASPITV